MTRTGLFAHFRREADFTTERKKERKEARANKTADAQLFFLSGSLQVQTLSFLPIGFNVRLFPKALLCSLRYFEMLKFCQQFATCMCPVTFCMPLCCNVKLTGCLYVGPLVQPWTSIDNVVCCIVQVEVWLNRLLDAMRDTVRHQMTESITAYEEKPRDQWLFDYPAQVRIHHAIQPVTPPPSHTALFSPRRCSNVHSQRRTIGVRWTVLAGHQKP